MKKLILLFAFMSATMLGKAQSTAQNWTHTDCISGNSYTLHNMLDSNKIAVMLFEMGCYSCREAGQALETVKKNYDSLKPGEVKFFVMDYWTGHTCANVQSFINDSNLTMAGFAGCKNDKDYYTAGSPMPMIVVAGGSSHNIYYKKLSFDAADVPAINSAINQALTDIAAGVNSHSTVPFSVAIASNPSMKEVYLNIASNGSQNLDVEVINILGQTVGTQKIELKEKGYSQVKLNLPPLTAGVYFVRYRYGNMYRTLKFMAGK